MLQVMEVERPWSFFSKPLHSGLEVNWRFVIFSIMAGWCTVSKCELCFQQQNNKDVVLNNEEQHFLFYKTSLSASVVLFMNNTLCICIMRQCLIEWLHNMLFHRIKYEIFIRPERELECLVVKSLTREIQLLLLPSSEYVSSLYKKALKATRIVFPKIYYPLTASALSQQAGACSGWGMEGHS